MKTFKKWLLDVDEKKIIKRATFWNLVASLLNSFMSAIFLFFITRINGVDKAGMFSIASAFAYQALSLGNFGVRNYHASDVKYDYHYNDYFYVRILSSVLMYLLLVWCAFSNGYSLEKSMIIIAFGLFKSIDCFEDLLHGEFQRKNRLDIGCILQSFRYMISMIVFVILLLFTKDFIVSCIILTVFTSLLFWIFNKPILNKYVDAKRIFNKKKVITLFFICLPICLGNAVNMYIANCPKYAIDSIMLNKFQTYYGILAMPVFTINLFSTVIYRPYVKKLGDSWQNKEYKIFFQLIVKQIFVILLLTVLISLFGYIIGLTALEFIYGVHLHKYMFAFILLLIGGGINSLAGYFSVVLTAARAQNKLFIGYVITFISAILFANPFVQHFGINGAAYLYCILNLITFILFTIFIFMKYKQDKRS